MTHGRIWGLCLIAVAACVFADGASAARKPPEAMTTRDTTTTPALFVSARARGATLKEMTDPISIKVGSGKIHPLELAKSLSAQSGCRVTVRYFIHFSHVVYAGIEAATWFDLAYQIKRRYGFILWVEKCSETGQIREVVISQIEGSHLPKPKVWITQNFPELKSTEADRERRHGSSRSNRCPASARRGDHSEGLVGSSAR